MTASRSFSCPRPHRRRPSPSVPRPPRPAPLSPPAGTPPAAPAQRQRPPSRRTDALRPSQPRATVQRSSRAAGAHGDSSSQAGPRCPGRAGATGQQLLSLARCCHCGVPRSLLATALPAAHIRRQICELLQKLLMCEMPRNITPAPPPPASPAARDGKLPCSVYPNSHFILMSGVEILSPWFCQVL